MPHFHTHTLLTPHRQHPAPPVASGPLHRPHIETVLIISVDLSESRIPPNLMLTAKVIILVSTKMTKNVVFPRCASGTIMIYIWECCEVASLVHVGVQGRGSSSKSTGEGGHHRASIFPGEYNNSGMITWIGSQHSQLQTFSFCLVNKCVEVLFWWFSICFNGLEWSVWQPCFSNTSEWVENAPKKQKGSESKSELHPSRSSARKGRRQYQRIPFLSDVTTSFFGWQYPISGFKLIETQSSNQPACHNGWLSCSCLFMKSFGLIYS